MTFNFEISIGDIIAFLALIGSVVMLLLTYNERRKTKSFAQNANSYNESAKKYYDLMVEKLNAEAKSPVNSNHNTITRKAYCDANIVKIANGKWILKIYNKGTANATDISFKYLIKDAPDILRPGGEAFPIKLLEPQKNVDYHLMIHLGLSASSWEYEISWKNEDGTLDSKMGVLTLPLS